MTGVPNTFKPIQVRRERGERSPNQYTARLLYIPTHARATHPSVTRKYYCSFEESLCLGSCTHHKAVVLCRTEGDHLYQFRGRSVY